MYLNNKYEMDEIFINTLKVCVLRNVNTNIVYSNKLDFFTKNLILLLGNFCIEEKMRYEINRKYHDYLEKMNFEFSSFLKTCILGKTVSRIGIDNANNYLIEIDGIKKKFDRLYDNFNTENVHTIANDILCSELGLMNCSIEELIESMEQALCNDFNSFFKKDGIDRSNKNDQDYYARFSLSDIEKFYNSVITKDFNRTFNEDFFLFMSTEKNDLLRDLFNDPSTLVYLNLYNVLDKNIDSAYELLYKIYCVSMGNKLVLSKDDFIKNLPKIYSDMCKLKKYGEKFKNVYFIMNKMTEILNNCYDFIRNSCDDVYGEIKHIAVSNDFFKQIVHCNFIEEDFGVELQRYIDIKGEECLLIDKSIDEFSKKYNAFKNFDEVDCSNKIRSFIRKEYYSKISLSLISNDILFSHETDELMDSLCSEFNLDKENLVMFFADLEGLWTKIDFYFRLKNILKFYYQSDSDIDEYFAVECVRFDEEYSSFPKLKLSTIDLFFSKFTLTFNKDCSIYDLIDVYVDKFFESDLSNSDMLGYIKK